MGKENRTILRIQQLAHIERSIRSGKPTVEPGIWYVHGIPKPAGVSAQIVLKEYKKTEEDFRVLNERINSRVNGKQEQNKPKEINPDREWFTNRHGDREWRR